jgi:hypothetical protein
MFVFLPLFLGLEVLFDLFALLQDRSKSRYRVIVHPEVVVKENLHYGVCAEGLSQIFTFNLGQNSWKMTLDALMVF